MPAKEELTDNEDVPPNIVVLGTPPQLLSETMAPVFRTTSRRKAVARIAAQQNITVKKKNERVRCRIQGLLLKETPSVKRWRQRWVTIVDNVVYYSDNVFNGNNLLNMFNSTNQDSDKDSCTSLNRIYGASILAVRECGQETGGFVFEIQTVKSVTRWCCDSENEMRKWTSALHDVIVCYLLSIN
jgi:hypothetical protein